MPNTLIRAFLQYWVLGYVILTKKFRDFFRANAMIELSDGAWGFLGALVGGAIAFAIASTRQYWSRVEDDLDHFRHQYVTALDYFDGGSQRRNIGISLLSSLWDHSLSKRHADVYRKSCALLFCNQCIYILRDGKNRFHGHEQDNLRRMMRLLLNFDEFQKSTGYAAQKQYILDSIAKYRGDAMEKQKLSDDIANDLDCWKKEIKSYLP